MKRDELFNELIELFSSTSEVSETTRYQLTILLSNYSIEAMSNDLVIYDDGNDEALIQKFYINKKVQGLSQRSVNYYLKELRKWSERLVKGFINVTTDDIKLVLAQRQLYSNVGAVTIKNEMRVLSSFYTWLAAEEIISKNPMAKLKIIKTPKVQKEAFEDIEVERMRTQLKSSKDKAVFELLLSTGCRVSELAGIKISDIKDNEKVIVHGKGSKDRIVYLNARAQLSLEQYLKDRKDSSDWLFPRMVPVTSLTGKQKTKLVRSEWYKNPELVDIDNHVDKGTIECMIRETGKKVGVKAYPHKFRRTCATWALRKGMPLITVSKMLGHESIETTQVYLDISEEELETSHKKYVT